MAEEVATSILGILVERMVDPIVRQFSYLFLYNTNIENLVQELKRLQAARDGAKRQVLAAAHNLESIDPVMQIWLEGVFEIEGKAFLVIQRKLKVEKLCFNMGCLNLSQRYSLSRKATKLIIGIDKLKSDGDKYAKLTHSASPPGILSDEALFPELPTWIGNSRFIPNSEGFETRKSTVEIIIKALKDDGIRMIGICGIGGVGKTTMANEVSKRAKAQGLFQEFAMTSVSQTQDLHKIQKELAGMLGLRLNDSDTIFLSSQRLRARLSNGKKILVILDDVWKELPLQQVGIPTGCMGCKVICTSRNKDVLSDMGTDNIFDVEVLTDGESWDLFKANAGSFNDTSDRYATAKRIVKKCGGLPIAIVTLAKALKDKEKYVWDNALYHLEESTGNMIHGMEENVYRCIELSYSFLKDSRARTLVLLCCLYPEDYDVYVVNLFEFKVLPAIEETEDGVRTLVGELICSNLLVAGKYEGQVKVHDIIREVCLSIEGLNKLRQQSEPSIWMTKRRFILPKRHALYEEAGSQAFKQAVNALVDDQIPTIGIIGDFLWRFVVELIEKVKEDHLFDDVALTFDLCKTEIDTIEQRLGMGSVSEVTSTEESAKQIWDKLTDGRKRRSLLILYGVAKTLDLEIVGIPVGGKHNKGCKVVIVSEFEKVCLDMGTEKNIFRVEPLSKKEALVLFRKHARFDQQLEPIAKRIVEICHGKPVSIARLGESLKNQSKNIWLHALRQIQGFLSEEVDNVWKICSCEGEMLWYLIRLLMETNKSGVPIENLVVVSERLKFFKHVKEEEGGDLEATREKVFGLLQELHTLLLVEIDANKNTASSVG